ncbi:MAG: zinc ribbon domain-containing protein [Acidobacteria bacterium]|nr:zinc ribbon domain-containing protein [Acidobacteriota bacterium]
MPFCTSCGANVEASTAFCTKCGASMAGATAAPAAGAGPAAGATPPKQGSSVLKIILMIGGVFVLLGVIVVGVVIYGAYRVAESVEQGVKEGRVETPLGTVETSDDPAEAAKNIEVELYPGATPLKEGSSSVNVGGMSATTIVLETPDSPQKVFEFYKAEFPNASMTTSEGDQHTIMSGGKDEFVTVVIAPEGGKTRITIARTSK